MRGVTTVRFIRFAAAALALASVLTGCSQVAAIAPVGGSREAEVRYAAIDVLLSAGINVRTAPACVLVDKDREVRCAGDTFDGEKIAAHSPADAPDTFSVTVGDRTLYTGSIHEVLEKAMQG